MDQLKQKNLLINCLYSDNIPNLLIYGDKGVGKKHILFKILNDKYSLDQKNPTHYENFILNYKNIYYVIDVSLITHTNNDKMFTYLRSIIEKTNYFKNQFYSNYLSRNLHDVQGKDESILIKPSSFALISDYLGIYTQKRNGKNIISFGFPDQKMSKDSQNLWNAFNQEFDKILKEPIKTNNLNNGFNSSIFEESI